MEYTFEKMAHEDMYQVRLGGEFVTYSSYANPQKIDNILFNRGYKDRADFYNQRIMEHLEKMEGLNGE